MSILFETDTNDIKLFCDYKQNLFDRFSGKIEDTGLALPDWHKLTNIYRPAFGTLNIVGGIPSHGKSSFMAAMAVMLSKYHGINWAVFSPEEYPTDRHIAKIIELWGGIKFSEKDTSKESAEKIYNDASPHFRFIEPKDENLTLSYVLNLTKDLILTDKTTGIIIDPWNELNNEKKDNQNETEYIGECLRVCRRFARSNNILFFILAHPAKMTKKPETEKYDVPTLYNISGSQHWYNKADNGLTVYRNFNTENPENETVDIFVQKIKFKSHGQIGTVRMKYNKYNGRFAEETNHNEIGF